MVGYHTEFSLGKAIVLEQLSHRTTGTPPKEQTHLTLALFFIGRRLHIALERILSRGSCGCNGHLGGEVKNFKYMMKNIQGLIDSILRAG